jgi:hypothetical protein
VTLRRLPGGIVVFLLAWPGVGKAAEASASPQCASPEHRRLDFWAGDWDAYEAGASQKPVARAHVDIILGGCVLRELYEQSGGVVGQSFTVYDSPRKLWHQTWVTNRGTLLQIDGKFQGGSLTMEGRQRTSDGREQIVRGVWTREDDGVREIAHTSSDDGKTWQPWFDILFRPHREQSSPK